jgi:hypothetical protein
MAAPAPAIKVSSTAAMTRYSRGEREELILAKCDTVTRR